MASHGRTARTRHIDFLTFADARKATTIYMLQVELKVAREEKGADL